MFLHLVLMDFNENADDAFFRRVNEFAERIRSECRSVVIYHFSKNEADRSDGLDYAIVAGFETSEAHDDYQISALHVEMKNYMGPFIRRLVVYDGHAPLPIP